MIIHLVLAALVTLVLGYVLYGRFLARKLQIYDTAPTISPAWWHR